MSLRKTSEPKGRAIFDPGAIIWTILVEAHLMKLPTKYQRIEPSIFGEQDFFFKQNPYTSLFKTSESHVPSSFRQEYF